MFARISATAFGGGQMSAMRREIVRNNRWLDDDEYLELYAIAQLLPGANPTNLAVLVGSRLRGWPGAAVALLAAVLPGFTILMVLAAVALDSRLPAVTGALTACAAVAVGLTLANAIELTLPRRRSVVDLSIVVAVALAVLVLHFSLALTLAVFVPLALLLTGRKNAA
ncbi:MAG TPA: chromate transporter [Dongiaceae bacterium]|nr:chromate transporter [Dongiaceae bacterium]